MSFGANEFVPAEPVSPPQLFNRARGQEDLKCIVQVRLLSAIHGSEGEVRLEVVVLLQSQAERHCRANPCSANEHRCDKEEASA